MEISSASFFLLCYAKCMDSKRKQVKFSNLDKVYFPKANVTKGDVIEYYRAISKYILPHLKDRPLTLKRYPDGINKQAIYQRHLTGAKGKKYLDSVSAYVEEDKKTKQFILCADTEGLLYLAQLGTIEIHPWHSQRNHLHHPSYIVFDLDPPKGNFKKAVKAALDLKKVLTRLKLKSFAKTSGKSGVHVFTPVVNHYSFERVRQFACGIGEELQKVKSNVTMEQRIKNRGSFVFFDCSQNSFSKSMVSVYSLRATPEATVSFPVEWGRLSKVKPTDFTIKNVPGLLKKGDAWSPLLRPVKNSIIF